MRNEIERVVVGIPQTTLDELVQEVKAVKELCESRFKKTKLVRNGYPPKKSKKS